jgi:hypothetical protein
MKSLLGAVVVVVALASCGDDGPPACKGPAECIALGADTCLTIHAHAQCVLGCAVENGQDSCPAPLECTGKADDGGTYCQGKPR